RQNCGACCRGKSSCGRGTAKSRRTQKDRCNSGSRRAGCREGRSAEASTRSRTAQIRCGGLLGGDSELFGDRRLKHSQAKRERPVLHRYSKSFGGRDDPGKIGEAVRSTGGSGSP